MSRTLADMTPEEREQCRGMWCDVQMMGGGTAQFIFSKLRPGPRMGAYLTEPGERMPWTAEYEAITPRFDLMRAWMPDGTPVDMDMEINEVSYGRVYNDGTGHVDFPDGTVVRRFVGDWEARK